MENSKRSYILSPTCAATSESDGSSRKKVSVYKTARRISGNGSAVSIQIPDRRRRYSTKSFCRNGSDSSDSSRQSVIFWRIIPNAGSAIPISFAVRTRRIKSFANNPANLAKRFAFCSLGKFYPERIARTRSFRPHLNTQGEGHPFRCPSPCVVQPI